MRRERAAFVVAALVLATSAAACGNDRPAPAAEPLVAPVWTAAPVVAAADALEGWAALGPAGDGRAAVETITVRTPGAVLNADPLRDDALVYSYADATARYELRLRVAGEYLFAPGGARDFAVPERAGRIEPDSGAGFCRNGARAVPLAPNRCDALAVSRRVLADLSRSFFSVGARGARFVPAVVPGVDDADRLTAAGYTPCDGSPARPRPIDTLGIAAIVGVAGIDALPGACGSAEQRSLDPLTLTAAGLVWHAAGTRTRRDPLKPTPEMVFTVEARTAAGDATFALTFPSASGAPPVAAIEAADPGTPARPLVPYEVDGAGSTSPAGPEFTPLAYDVRVADQPVEARSLARILATGDDGDDPPARAAGFASSSRARFFAPVTGDYGLTCAVRDLRGLVSVDRARLSVSVRSADFVRIELTADTPPGAALDLIVARNRLNGSFGVPAQAADIQPTPPTCNRDGDCNRGYCLETPAGRRCTNHQALDYGDSAWRDNPAPDWGDAGPADDPRWFSRFGGRVQVVRVPAVRRPTALRVGVRLRASDDRTAVADNPVRATVVLSGPWGREVVSGTLFFRSGDPRAADVPVWKTADLNLDSGGRGTFAVVPRRDETCLIPAECACANPLNAVSDAPLDPDAPGSVQRTVWCDGPGDPRCLIPCR